MRAIAFDSLQTCLSLEPLRKSTERAVARAGLRSFVDEIVSVDEVRRFKPAREVYLHAARQLDAPPRQVCFVAAHGWDVEGAKRAGMRTAFVTTAAASPARRALARAGLRGPGGRGSASWRRTAGVGRTLLRLGALSAAGARP